MRAGEGEATGLCADCRWARTVENRRGSRFLLCRKAAEDERLTKYPRLPVLRCHGFEARHPEVSSR
jgi:hypothetical protein